MYFTLSCRSPRNVKKITHENKWALNSEHRAPKENHDCVLFDSDFFDYFS